MKILKTPAEPLGWGTSLLYLGFSVACFHLAYASPGIPAAALLIFGYAFFLVRITHQPTVRRAFYFGLAAGFTCAADQAFFFWRIFGPSAIVLWIVFAFWIGLFTAISCGSIRRWGKVIAAGLIPFIWTGLEYFRSELYYFKFSWLNIGYALSRFQIVSFGFWGMYGVGFLVFAIAATLFSLRAKIGWAVILVGGTLLVAIPSLKRAERPLPMLSLVGVQTEFPPTSILPKLLDQVVAKHTNAPIFVLSEYTLDGPVPDSLKNWCREHSRYLVVGGKDPVGTNNFYDTAFVVGANGEVVFKQAKCVPIQFFNDGLPARKQEVWDSPWGKIGICICYDLSYTRVTDRLIEKGAQLLIVPTMDVEAWGRHEHELHSRIAPVRAAEYGVPIFRVASSGISEAVTGSGRVTAHTSFPGVAEILSASLRLPRRGSLPLDRGLAPFCVGTTGGILIALLILEWKDKRKKSKAKP